MHTKCGVMQIKGCGYRNSQLTFYRLPGVPKSPDSISRLACGDRAESRGDRGVVLCVNCARLHGLRREQSRVGEKISTKSPS
jgi:hypothetical protein